MGSHSHPREEEFSHRLTQLGNPSQCEVSPGPFARVCEEYNTKCKHCTILGIVARIPVWRTAVSTQQIQVTRIEVANTQLSEVF